MLPLRPFRVMFAKFLGQMLWESARTLLQPGRWFHTQCLHPLGNQMRGSAFRSDIFIRNCCNYINQFACRSLSCKNLVHFRSAGFFGGGGTPQRKNNRIGAPQSSSVTYRNRTLHWKPARAYIVGEVNSATRELPRGAKARLNSNGINTPLL